MRTEVVAGDERVAGLGEGDTAWNEGVLGAPLMTVPPRMAATAKREEGETSE